MNESIVVRVGVFAKNVQRAKLELRKTKVQCFVGTPHTPALFRQLRDKVDVLGNVLLGLGATRGVVPWPGWASGDSVRSQVRFLLKKD